jgi:hypothetical protein
MQEEQPGIRGEERGQRVGAACGEPAIELGQRPQDFVGCIHRSYHAAAPAAAVTPESRVNTAHNQAPPEERSVTDAHEHHDHGHEHHHVLSYEDAIGEFRADKDAFFQSAPNSPIPEAEREAFSGLPYYPVDESLRFDDLTLEPYKGDEPVRFEIPTSDGRTRAAERAGVFTFPVEGADRTLTAYIFEGGDAESVFVPFVDATSGSETYGAGRYLDIEREDDGTYSLDFNLAYHPSCVYDPRFSCPLTPAENRLTVPIRAGERLAP